MSLKENKEISRGRFILAKTNTEIDHLMRTQTEIKLGRALKKDYLCYICDEGKLLKQF